LLWWPYEEAWAMVGNFCGEQLQLDDTLMVPQAGGLLAALYWRLYRWAFKPMLKHFPRCC